MLKYVLTTVLLAPMILTANQNIKPPIESANNGISTDVQSSAVAQTQNKSPMEYRTSAKVTYETLKGDAKNTESMSGIGFAAHARASAREFLGITPFIQTGGHWSSVGNVIVYKPLPGLTQEFSNTLNTVMLSADFGVEIPMKERVLIDLSAGYAMGIFGRMKTTEKSGPLEKTTEQTAESLRNVNLGARALYQIATGIDVGADLTYKASGQLKVNDTNTSRYSGYAIGMSTQYSF